MNLFDDLPDATAAEVLSTLLSRPGLLIERIVSHGQATPVDSPYVQPDDEWVLVLRGAAGLWLEGLGERILHAGDTVLIPAHCRHRVCWTARGEPTIWLAIHFS